MKVLEELEEGSKGREKGVKELEEVKEGSEGRK